MTDEGQDEASKPAPDAPKKRPSRRKRPPTAIGDTAREAVRLGGALPKSTIGDALRRTGITSNLSAEEARRLTELGPGIKGLNLAGDVSKPKLGESLGLSKIKLTGLTDNIPQSALVNVLGGAKLGIVPGQNVKALAGLAGGFGQAFDPVVVKREYAAAQALIRRTSKENQASQDAYRALINERPVVSVTVPPDPSVLALQRVDGSVLALLDTMKDMLVVTKALLTVSENATLASAAADTRSAKSDEVIKGLTRWLVILTGILVVVTIVLAIPTAATFWHEVLVPFWNSVTNR